ncbi:MAG: VTT domain-containing protein [Candidatus Limnocylindrales bacterium]
MDLLAGLAGLILHPRELIEPFGVGAYLVLFAVLFAETGLFVGFFLPGDSLLVVAGVLSAPGSQSYTLNIVAVVLVCAAAAVTGNLTGFWFGRRVGRALFDRPDSRFFKRRYLEAADALYQRHGGITIVIARFIPFVRTFAPIVAGISHMERSAFALWTLVGGVLWACGLPLAGYLLGEAMGSRLDALLLPLIVLIIFVSVLPPAIHAWRSRRPATPQS